MKLSIKKGKLNTNADTRSRIKISNDAQPVQMNFNSIDNFSIQGYCGSTIHSAEEGLGGGFPIS